MSTREWQREVYAKALKKLSERKSRFQTSSGTDVSPLYDAPSPRTLGVPGEAPFTRGVQTTMYRSKLWTMRQYAGFGDAEESNRRYHFLLSQGQTGLSVAFDLPTQMGYDSDSERALGEVGKVGVAIDTLADMQLLLKGLPLAEISTSMTINATASTLLCLYIATAEAQGVAPDKLNGTIQNDILKEYIARGTYIFPPAPSMRLTTDVFAFCKERVPKWNTISISGYHIREAGATAAQELAFTLSDGIAYVDAALKAGLHVDEFAPRLAFFFNVHNNFLEEVAKFRAARTLWAEIMGQRFGAKDPRSLGLRFHAQTAGSTLTAQQPDNNVVRVTLQALAAVMGGAQSLHTNSRDEAIGLPTEAAVQLALRTQQIIAYESGVADTIDALGGSFAIEALTDDLIAKAKVYIHEIDRQGGAVKAIEQGYQTKEIEDAAYAYQRAVEEKREVVVGMNQFTTPGEPKMKALELDPALEERQKRRLGEVKAGRNKKAVSDALTAITAAAKSGDNLVPKILDAVRVYGSVGEISDAMRVVFGEHDLLR
ncbi:MAG: methylmalonyl-CoA mutase [Deltaproteobacteria bacterium]|nr:methylmalonyl-CoA mutase [Deltaproteobacteria bacterium]